MPWFFKFLTKNIFKGKEGAIVGQGLKRKWDKIMKVILNDLAPLMPKNLHEARHHALVSKMLSITLFSVYIGRIIVWVKDDVLYIGITHISLTFFLIYRINLIMICWIMNLLFFLRTINTILNIQCLAV